MTHEEFEALDYGVHRNFCKPQINDLGSSFYVLENMLVFVPSGKLIHYSKVPHWRVTCSGTSSVRGSKIPSGIFRPVRTPE